MKEDRFPKPVRVGRRSLWLLSEIQGWIARRKIARDQVIQENGGMVGAEEGQIKSAGDSVGENAFRTHLDSTRSTFASEDVILFTHTGCTMLVKPFNDDLACHVQRQIISGDFAAARLLSGQHAPSQPIGYFGDGYTLIESISRTLNLAPSSSLGMCQKLGEKAGHTDLVPGRIDSPKPVRVDRRSLRPLPGLKWWMAEQKNARDPGQPTGG
ncbi:AlpA family phage regulatory protein [Xanthomonas oryzae]|uniref:helix-turn-helix transcriptional regulator n=1 Tax=Xanthomonas oryzae TaxID=347 RepID=UPI001034CDED|nr:AlpA family phage regulatory protein [Xanthomonas oryzae]QBG89161.1 AlpA family phage regulatory protein [Xanthomonas oryzae]